MNVQKDLKVAIVSSDNSEIVRIGGKHVHQNLLVKGLRELGAEVKTFYLPWYMVLDTFIGKVLTIMRHPSMVFSYYSRYITRFREISRYFERINFEGYSIVHGHDVLSILNVKHKNIVLTVHGYLAKEVLNYMKKEISSKEKERIYEACLEIEKKAVSKAKHIIAVDTRLKDYHIDELGVPPDKITVVYNAIDTERFKPVSNKEKTLLRKQLGLPEEKFIVLVPRRYVDKNGVTYAAEAFARMKDDDYFFVLAGGGPLKEKIKDILRFNENALVLDGVPHEQVVRFYQASDVILVPSITSKEGVEEATSLSMLEGMACGKVVICTPVGGMKEVVKHMENGILIEQKNPDAIVDAIVFAKEHYGDLEKIRETAREYVVKHHSYLEHAKKVLEIYLKVLDKD
jgi:glycosyltransferase involved in cell wall biosynthesis